MTTTLIQEVMITTIQQSALRWRRQRGWRATKSAMAARAMATTKRVAGERRRRIGRWRQQQGRRVTKRVMARAARVMATPTKRTRAAGDTEGGATPTKRAMVAATRAVGVEEGNIEGGESDGDGDKEGDGEKEGEGPHLSSYLDRLPPRHMLPRSSSDLRPPSAPSWPPCWPTAEATAADSRRRQRRASAAQSRPLLLPRPPPPPLYRRR